MKKHLFLMFVYALIPLLGMNAQSQVVRDMTNALTELTGSFLDNPYHHSNTVKVNDLTQQFKSTIEEMYRQVPREAETDFYAILNMKKIIKSLDFITANISGYLRGGYDAAEWEATFNAIMPSFGWTWKVIHSTEDIIFFEYSKDNFKMVLAKNILPKKDYGDYNAVAFACDSWDPRLKRVTSGTRRVVFGGNYQFVTFGDDENKYNKISKVASKRGTSFDSFK
jgi:hypothetical protein